MKYPSVIILILFFITIGKSQNLDSTAAIPIDGIRNLYITPQQKFLIFDDKDYYTQNLEDRLWKINQIFYPKGGNYISLKFINDSIWIAYASIPLKELDKKAVYIARTEDKGSTWEEVFIDYTGKEYYDGFGDLWSFENGQIWLSGTDNRIYLSNNFGENWKVINIPTSFETSIERILMKDDTIGAFITDTQIGITNNNFSNVKKLPTPYEQKLVSHYFMSDLHLQNDKLIVEQWSKYFICSFNDTIWHPFYPNIIKNVKRDRITRELFGLTKNGKIVKFEDDVNSYQEYLSLKGFKVASHEWQIINGIVYINKNYDDIYVISVDTTIHKKNHLYTNDFTIEEPHIIFNISGKKWGFNYIFDGMYLKKSKKWFRVSYDYFYNAKSKHSWGFQVSDFPSPMVLDSLIMILNYGQFSELNGVKTNLIYYDTKNFNYLEVKSLEQNYIWKIDSISQKWFCYGFDTTQTGNLFSSENLKDWELEFSWENEILTNIFTKSKDSVYILSRKGSISLLTWKNGKINENVLIKYDKNNDKTVYPSNYYPFKFYFTNDTLGYVKGGEGGSHTTRTYKTTDGGKTWKKLDTRFSIKALQEVLIEKGYQLEITEILDETTRNALIDFQKKNDLPLGRLDIRTLQKLGFE